MRFCFIQNILVFERGSPVNRSTDRLRSRSHPDGRNTEARNQAAGLDESKSIPCPFKRNYWSIAARSMHKNLHSPFITKGHLRLLSKFVSVPRSVSDVPMAHFSSRLSRHGSSLPPPGCGAISPSESEKALWWQVIYRLATIVGLCTAILSFEQYPIRANCATVDM